MSLTVELKQNSSKIPKNLLQDAIKNEKEKEKEKEKEFLWFHLDVPSALDYN